MLKFVGYYDDGSWYAYAINNDIEKFYDIYSGIVEPDDTVYEYDFFEEYYHEGNKTAEEKYNDISPLISRCASEETVYIPYDEFYNMVSDDDY